MWVHLQNPGYVTPPELIGSFTNTDNLQILLDEPTADQKNYMNIATTSDYKLYLKSK
jgi:hypothetical protein